MSATELTGKRTTIVGLGLMGGSLAMALRPHLPYLVVVDTNSETLAAAATLADLATTELAAGLHQAELVILATPVRATLKLLASLPDIQPDGCLVLDLASTKVEVCRAMEQLPSTFQAIGGHPMCGKETAGFAAATADLYQGQTFVLCYHGRTGREVEGVVVDLIGRIGARPLFLPPGVHDELVAATSHLPYLLAAALVRTVAAAGDNRHWQLSASGFRDTSRLAGSDPQMMLDILLTNRAAILDALHAYGEELAAVARLLEAANEQSLLRWVENSQAAYAAYRREKEGR